MLLNKLQVGRFRLAVQVLGERDLPGALGEKRRETLIRKLDRLATAAERSLILAEKVCRIGGCREYHDYARRDRIKRRELTEYLGLEIIIRPKKRRGPKGR